MTAKTYGLLFVEEGSSALIVPSTHRDQVLVLDKETLSGTTLYDGGDWHEDHVYNERALLVPISVKCPACGKDAELWWLRGCYYSQHFVVCDCECQQAIQLEGCDG